MTGKRYTKTKKSVRTVANGAGNKEGLRSKRVDKNTSCYCGRETQWNLSSRIVHLRQWQSRGRRKRLCAGGSLPAHRISTWDTAHSREGAREAGVLGGERWPRTSSSLITLQRQTSASEKLKILLQIYTELHKQPGQEFENSFRMTLLYFSVVQVTFELDAGSFRKYTWTILYLRLDNHKS